MFSNFSLETAVEKSAETPFSFPQTDGKWFLGIVLETVDASHL